PGSWRPKATWTGLGRSSTRSSSTRGSSDRLGGREGRGRTGRLGVWGLPDSSRTTGRRNSRSTPTDPAGGSAPSKGVLQLSLTEGTFRFPARPIALTRYGDSHGCCPYRWSDCPCISSRARGGRGSGNAPPTIPGRARRRGGLGPGSGDPLGPGPSLARAMGGTVLGRHILGLPVAVAGRVRPPGRPLHSRGRPGGPPRPGTSGLPRGGIGGRPPSSGAGHRVAPG